MDIYKNIWRHQQNVLKTQLATRNFNDFPDSVIFSPDVTLGQEMLHITPSSWQNVQLVVKLVRLRKKILLKVSNTALRPKPVLVGGRAARLSHDVVMLSEEES